VIRFSALLVAVATGLLVAGVVASKLALVYVAIGVSAVALLALAVGAGLKRNELFGPAASVPGESPQPVHDDQPVRSAQRAETEAMPVAAGGGAAGAAWGRTSASASAYGPDRSASAYGPDRAPAPAPDADPFPAAATWPPATAAAAWPPATAGPPAPPAAAKPATSAPEGTSTWSSARRDRWSGLPEAGRFDTRPAAFAPPARPVEPAPAADEAESGAQIAEPVAAAAEAGTAAAAEAGTAVEAEGDQEKRAAEEPALPAEDAAPEPALAATAPADTSAEETEAVSNPATAEAEAPADVTAGETAEATATSDAEAEAPADASADEAPGRRTAAGDAGTKSAAAADPLREVAVVPGVPRYHNARCILIRFMGDDDLEKMTLAEAKNAGCTPCRACLPDQETD
jgi:hypothetical protein